MTQFIYKAITVVMAFLLAVPGQAETDKPAPIPSHKLYFSLTDEFGGAAKEAITEFDCNDKIFTVVELQHYDTDTPYHLSVKWLNPDGNVQEHTQYPFNVSSSETRLWAWLSLSRATGAGMIQWLNPAAGLEEFIGEWEVQVRINDKMLDTKHFQVLC